MRLSKLGKVKADLSEDLLFEHNQILYITVKGYRRYAE